MIKVLVDYRPFKERTVDTQYRQLLKRILHDGEEVRTPQGPPALEVYGHLMRFELANGFPIITERDLIAQGKKSGPQYVGALAELVAFLNGAQTLDEMRGFGCDWWARWLTPKMASLNNLAPGDLGPGSYGAAFRRFPTAEGVPFDQIVHLVEQIKELPYLRTHEVSPWIPQYVARGKGKTRRVVVAPCHGWINVHINTDRRTLKLTHRQRSADAPVGLAFNLIQYAALAMMLGQVTGYRPVELVYFVDSAQIYLDDSRGKSQVPDVEEMLATEPGRFPTVTIDQGVRDIFAFRPEHFHVTDYDPKGRRMVIWTPE